MNFWVEKDYMRCECRAEKENINHVLFSCQKFIAEREFMYRK